MCVCVCVCVCARARVWRFGYEPRERRMSERETEREMEREREDEKETKRERASIPAAIQASAAPMIGAIDLGNAFLLAALMHVHANSPQYPHEA